MFPRWRWNLAALPLDENEGIYVPDIKTGRVRAIIGETYMLSQVCSCFLILWLFLKGFYWCSRSGNCGVAIFTLLMGLVKHILDGFNF